MMSESEAVVVLMGGPGREAEISRRSGTAVAAGLRAAGHAVAMIDLAGELGDTPITDGVVVFNLVHGTYGEDGTLQTELDARGLTYVGSDAAASRLCMDKHATRQKLKAAGIRVAWGVPVDLSVPCNPRTLGLPHLGGYVLKPAQDGSSVGLYLIASPSFLLPTLETIVQEVGTIPYLLEERLAGPEYTVAVIDDEDGQPQAQPPLRIVPAGDSYDYHAKYQADTTRYELVEDGGLRDQLSTIAMHAHSVCGCRDLSRVDLMASADGDLCVLEINTLPGFTDHSLVPKAAAAAGRNFQKLVSDLVGLAGRRSRMKESDG